MTIETHNNPLERPRCDQPTPPGPAAQRLCVRRIVFMNPRARALGSSIVLCTTLSGCVPLVSRHDPVRVEAARFVDRESGATVPEVLVIPRFASYSGVATGHGSGNMAKAALVAEPRIHRSGEVLLLPGGSVLGLWWAFVVVTARY